jgi:2-dehydro-3-deoxyphosphogluconate aldolase/(4S)-4-hydroxy-2-oxoglutarate aldolase
MVNRRNEGRSAINEQRVVAIVRSASADAAYDIGRRLVADGLRAVEVSMTTPGALSAVERLAAEAGPGVVIGAGTVLDEASAEAAIRHGAQFVVSPVLVPAVVRTANRRGVVCIPGAATPTEMLSALELGADFVKIFPAAAWTPRLVADVLEALPQLPLVPTGGVAVATAHEWIAAGAAAVGIGGALTRIGSDEVQPLLHRVAAAAR